MKAIAIRQEIIMLHLLHLLMPETHTHETCSDKQRQRVGHCFHTMLQAVAMYAAVRHDSRYTAPGVHPWQAAVASNGHQHSLVLNQAGQQAGPAADSFIAALPTSQKLQHAGALLTPSAAAGTTSCCGCCLAVAGDARNASISPSAAVLLLPAEQLEPRPLLARTCTAQATATL